MSSIIVLTGTCGSGKTTVSKLLAARPGWIRISEDEVWKSHFGKNRGIAGSEEHRRKRGQVHDEVFAGIIAARKKNESVVIDATVHESPPEAYGEYRSYFETNGMRWILRVLHPRLEVAVARDSLRTDWVAGKERVGRLYAKFTHKIFGPECFIDNSDESPEQTMLRLLNSDR